MNKRMIYLLIVVFIILCIVLACKYWPSRRQAVDAVIDVYIRIVCEK